MNDRQGFVGGSDVAAILGLSPYGSPYSVWLEKVTGLTVERSDEMEERLELGKDAEQFLASVFNRHHRDAGIAVDLREYGQLELGSDTYPWLRGHADGLVFDATTKHADGWEAKTDRSFTPWKEIPAYYQCQAQTYMMLTGLDHWWFTVGFAGWNVKHYVVEADADDQALIAKATETFWRDHVLTGIAPDPDAHPATTAAIRHRYNITDPDDILYADPITSDYIHLLHEAKRNLDSVRNRVTLLENAIKDRLADCAELRDDHGILATWRAQTTDRIDVKRLRAELPHVADEYTNTTTTRVFRLKDKKD
jgi:putative phage-type endonuclease